MPWIDGKFYTEPEGAPPVPTRYWTAEDFTRWENTQRARRLEIDAAIRALHEKHPENAWWDGRNQYGHKIKF